MIELAAAAWIPPLVLFAIVFLPRWLTDRRERPSDDLSRAVTFWFIPLALLWFAPCWLTGRSPAPLDYLAEDVAPWTVSGYSAEGALLSDVALQFLPWRESVRQSVYSGAMPLLDRFNASGSPLWENPQSGATWALTWIGLPFTTWAWPLFAAMSKVLAAMVGTYLFLRAEERSHQAAVYGAIAYAFCAFNIAFLLFPHTNVTVLLPWLLWALRRSVIWFSIITALMLSAGHPESVLHAALIAIPFAATIVWRASARGRVAAKIVAGGLAGILMSAPAWLPFALYLPFTERVARLARQPEILAVPPLTASNLTAFFAAPALLWTRNPNLLMNFNEIAGQYAGLAAFALAVAVAVFDARRQRFWIVTALIACVFAFESPLARAITSHIPIVNVTVHGRLRFIIAFAIAVLASRAIDLLDERRMRIAAIASLLSMAVVSLMLTRNPAAMAAVAAAALTAFAVAKPSLRRLLPLFAFADLAALLILYNAPITNYLFSRPRPALQFLLEHRGRHRVIGIANALRPNTTSYLGIEGVGFHDPMAFESYGRVLDSAGYDRRTYFNSFARVPPRQLLDVLGVRYVVAPPDYTFTGLPVVCRGEDALIFENRSAMPRAFALGSRAKIAIERYEPNSEAIAVQSDEAARIVTSEIALPGWRLTRDGEPWPIVKVSGAFIGFAAPAGSSRFELKYVPRGLELGGVLAVLGLGCLILLKARLEHRAPEST